MRHIRILIVDDDTAFRQRIQELLVSIPDFEVVGEAVDGQKAIHKAQELRPDLVLMDIRMPGMSGVEATHQLKNAMPALKILILTVFDEQEYRDSLKTIGADGYVVKKSLLDELIPTVRHIFQPSTKKEENSLQMIK